jgi:hypothetical protein
VKALGPTWLGVSTDDFEGPVTFLRDVLGLAVAREDEDFAILRLTNGEAVEVFGPTLRDAKQFATGPVVGFRVDDVRRAREEMRNGESSSSARSTRATGRRLVALPRPGGKVYEITRVPEGGLRG